MNILDNLYQVTHHTLGGRDWSGLAYDAHSDTMWAVRNSSSELIELDMEGHVLRRVDLVGCEDVEDLCIWKTGEHDTWLYLLEERPRNIVLVEVPRASTSLGRWRRWSLSPSGDNRGPEGITIDRAAARVLIASEKPSRVDALPLSHLLPSDAAYPLGETRRVLLELAEPITDCSAICWHDNHLLVLSDESKVLIELARKGHHWREVARLGVPGFRQPEGVAVDGRGRVWVVSEPDDVFVFARREGLLPPGRSPVDEGLFGNPIVAEVFACFDASEGAKRHYDWVNPLDGITVWCGHWPQSRLGKLLKALRADEHAWDAFTLRACELGVDDLLEYELMDPNWRKRHAPLYDVEWVRELFAYAGRDEVVARWQARFWVRDVFEPAAEVTRTASVLTLGGLASMVSMGSSASSWPEVFAATLGDEDQDERALLAWLWYLKREGRVRSRMRAIWERFYAATWGPSWERPTQTGVGMTTW